MHVATLCGSHHSGSPNAVALDTVSRGLRAGGRPVARIDVSASDALLLGRDLSDRMD